jgi:hypothetical protein
MLVRQGQEEGPASPRSRSSAPRGAGMYAANTARIACRYMLTVAGAADVQLALHARVSAPAACRLEVQALPAGPVQWGVPAPVRTPARGAQPRAASAFATLLGKPENMCEQIG